MMPHSGSSPTRRLSTWIVVLTAIFSVGGGALALMFHVLHLPLQLYIWVMVMVVAYFTIPFTTGTVDQPLLTRQRAVAFFGVIPIIAAATTIVLMAIGLQGWALLYAFSSVLVASHFAFVMWIEKR